MNTQVNALTIDVEDYYQVSAFEKIVKRSEWHTYESRVEKNTEAILHLLDQGNTKATFFVLGWVAKHAPALIRKIHNNGHEIASHGYDHTLVYNQTPATFKNDVVKSKKILEDIIGEKIIGYRAPSYSINKRSWWALKILEELEFQYDSSIFPIRHDRYGIPGYSRDIHKVGDKDNGIIEFPISTVTILGSVIPACGGGYLRLFPYWFTRFAINKINEKENKPAIVYFHPWEIDPDQPKIGAGYITKLRHYNNINSMNGKLLRLLDDFTFKRMKDVLTALQHLP